MQVVLFWKSRWAHYWLTGGPKGYPGFYAIRVGRLEFRFGLGRFGMPWGRPRDNWAFYNG
jgi:hypothetical protein